MSRWQLAKLVTVTTKVGSGATPRGGKDAYKSAGIPLIRSQNVHSDGFRYEGLAFLDDDQADALKSVEVRADDVLLNITGASIGRVTIAPGRMAGARVNQHVCIIRPKLELRPEFLRWYLASPDIQHIIFDIQTGVTRQALTKEQILSFDVPLPPLDVQEAVVAEIEKQFSRLDEAVASLNRIQSNLKRYKAAVLKAAVEGKLTEQWRKEHPDVEPAEQLLKRILAERRAKWEAEELAKMKGKGIKPKDDSWKKKYKEPAGPDTANLPELPEGWLWVSLESISDVIDPNPSHRMPKYVPKGIPLISSENFVSHVEIDFTKGKQVADETFQEQRNRYKVEPGDFAFSRIGTIGKTMFLPIDKEYCLSHALVLIKAIGPELSRKYLKTALSSDAVLMQAREGVQSVGVPDLGMAKMRSFQIPLPPCIEQLAVVDEIDRRLSVTEELEATIKANLKRAERLRQTILQQAFIGDMKSELK